MLTIKELITKMKENENLNLEEILEMRTYIPIAEKRTLIEDIVNASSRTENGFLEFDSIGKKINFEVAMVKYHTNIHMGIDIAKDYDEIHENLASGITLASLLKSYYKEDYHECMNLLEEAIKDLFCQHSTEASIAHMAKVISEGVAKLSDSITNKVEQFDMDTLFGEDVDTSEFLQMLAKYGK